MANHPSALKRARQNKVSRQRNMAHKTKAKNVLKEARAAIADNNTDQVQDKVRKAVSVLQKTADKDVIHKRNAARKISRLTRQANQLISKKSS